jgi:hypothetical protein
MPAETHQCGESVSTEQVVELVLAIAALDQHPVAEHATLADVGFDGDLAIYDLLGAVAEELGERSLSAEEPDLDQVGPSTTLVAFAETIVVALDPHRRAGGA